VKRRTHNASIDLFGTLARNAAFGPWRSTGIRLLGLGVWLRVWLRVFLLSTRLPIRLCRLGLARLGLASWMASVVAANMQ
jgi:hypothetical protein